MGAADMKTCTKCQESFPLDHFYAHPSTADGRFPECKPCNRRRAREWQAQRRQADPQYAADVKLRQLYGISRAQYLALLDSQGGGCAVCGRADSGQQGRRFHVDHDHDCCPGKRSCGTCIRGLLCHGCNTGLGNFGDDPDRLVAAAAYLLARSNVLGEVARAECQ